MKPKYPVEINNNLQPSDTFKRGFWYTPTKEMFSKRFPLGNAYLCVTAYLPNQNWNEGYVDYIIGADGLAIRTEAEIIKSLEFVEVKDF